MPNKVSVRLDIETFNRIKEGAGAMGVTATEYSRLACRVSCCILSRAKTGILPERIHIHNAEINHTVCFVVIGVWEARNAEKPVLSSSCKPESKSIAIAPELESLMSQVHRHSIHISKSAAFRKAARLLSDIVQFDPRLVRDFDISLGFDAPCDIEQDLKASTEKAHDFHCESRSISAFVRRVSG